LREIDVRLRFGISHLGAKFGYATIPNEATVTVAASENGLVSETCEEANYSIFGGSVKPVSVHQTAITATQVGGLN
jgi:hypothetical protein